MNALVNATPNRTMTSKQIALVVNSRHDSVKRTIERLANQSVISFTPMVETSHEGSGSRSVEVYHVNERDSYVVVAQLCPAETAKLVDYWMATKDQALAIPQDLPTALRLAADLAEQLAIAQPKALALDRIADTESVFTIRETAKTIKIKERELTALLLKRKWAYRDSRKVMQPYAETIARGYVIAVMTAPITGGDGQDRVFSQLRITAKGVTRLGYLVAKKVVA